MCFSSKVFLPSDSHRFCLQCILGDGVCSLAVCTAPRCPHRSGNNAPVTHCLGLRPPWRKAGCSWGRGSRTSFRQRALGGGFARAGLVSALRPAQERGSELPVSPCLEAPALPRCGPGGRRHCPRGESSGEDPWVPSLCSCPWTPRSPRACSLRGPGNGSFRSVFSILALSHSLP